MKLKYAKQIVNILREKGNEAYFVGGCVRDMVMNIEPMDYDIATSAHPEEISKIFPRTESVGARFGVTLVIHNGLPFEVATFRSDQAYIDGRHPSGVVFTTAQQDVKRRDFTINGLLYDPTLKKVIDHVGGVADIEKRVIRSIGDPYKRFDEDKLRLLRAIRLGARLGYSVEEETWKAIVSMAPHIHQVSVERIRDELVRILTEGQALCGMRLMKSAGILREILPEIDWTAYLEKCVEKIELGEKPEFAVGVLLHQLRSEQANAITARFRFSNEESSYIISLIGQQQYFLVAQNMATAALKRFLRMERFEEHLRLHQLCVMAGDGELDNYNYLRNLLNEWSITTLSPAPLVSGYDLIAMGMKPGPLFKEILIAVETEQLEGRLTNQEEAFEYLRGRFFKSKS